MGTVRFVLRTDKPTSDGKSPIELVYQLSGNRKYYRTREKLQAENWNGNDQKARYLDKREAKKVLPGVDFETLPLSKEVEELNNRLASLRTEINSIEKAFEANKVAYSAEMVVNSIKANRSPLTKKEAPAGQVFDFIDQYITDNQASRNPGSLTVYKTLKKHLKGYETEKKTRIKFSDINHSFFQSFQNYLLRLTKTVAGEEVPALYNVTIAKQLTTLKTFLNYAKLHGIQVSDRYKEFKVKKEKLEVIALTEEEFESLWKLDLANNKTLDQVRDIFIFSVVTGLRHSDLTQLKREHIKKDSILLTATKTKKELNIPLNPYSYALLDKYKHLYHPLPKYTNQPLNRYLKDLCKLAGIEDPVQIVRFHGAKREEVIYPKYELISIHTGRKTFATLSLERGMSAEEVMELGGWESYASFKRYVNITKNRIKVVMRKAWGELPQQVLKAV